MKSFRQWAESNNKSIEDVIADVETNVGTKQDENGRRTALNPLLPIGYGRNQLPDAAFAPYKATAFLDQENAKKYGNKTRKDAGETPL